MPSRHLIRTYAENTIYHVYNRGVEKRIIFEDEQDYKVFLNYLKEYLSPPPKPEDVELKNFYLKDRIFKGVERQPKNYHKKVELLAYCLMPNHFHFIIKQNEDKGSIKDFMHSLLIRYSMYFNRRYERVGGLFQSKFKAIIVMDEVYLLHLSRYIHINPIEIFKDLVNAYSSYAEYLRIRHTPWIETDIILSYFENQKITPEFKKTNTYKLFVEKYLEENKDLILDETEMKLE